MTEEALRHWATWADRELRLQLGEGVEHAGRPKDLASLFEFIAEHPVDDQAAMLAALAHGVSEWDGLQLWERFSFIQQLLVMSGNLLWHYADDRGDR